MSLLPLILVVAAAVIHATWNLLSKQAAEAGAVFVAVNNGIITLLYAPWVIWLLLRDGMTWSPAIIACILASAVANLAYTLCLQRGYRVADLSVVYPVARGAGPVLSTLGAFLILGEQASPAGLAGLAAVVVGIGLIASNGRLGAFREPAGMAGVGWGLATGVLIATYSVIDAWGVKVLELSPVLLVWFSNLMRLPMLAPLLLRDPAGAMARMQGRWGLALGVGLLAPLSYILVLWALALGGPLSLVAPLRETSMMAAALLGFLVLRERVGLWRLAGCGAVVLGAALLAGA